MLFGKLSSTTWVWSLCQTNSDAFNALCEPPYTEPYVRWCGRTAGATPPPTDLYKQLVQALGCLSIRLRCKTCPTVNNLLQGVPVKLSTNNKAIVVAGFR